MRQTALVPRILAAPVPALVAAATLSAAPNPFQDLLQAEVPDFKLPARIVGPVALEVIEWKGRHFIFVSDNHRVSEDAGLYRECQWPDCEPLTALLTRWLKALEATKGTAVAADVYLETPFLTKDARRASYGGYGQKALIHDLSDALMERMAADSEGKRHRYRRSRIHHADIRKIYNTRYGGELPADYLYFLYEYADQVAALLNTGTEPLADLNLLKVPFEAAEAYARAVGHATDLSISGPAQHDAAAAMKRVDPTDWGYPNGMREYDPVRTADMLGRLLKTLRASGIGKELADYFRATCEDWLLGLPDRIRKVEGLGTIQQQKQAFDLLNHQLLSKSAAIMDLYTLGRATKPALDSKLAIVVMGKAHNDNMIECLKGLGGKSVQRLEDDKGRLDLYGVPPAGRPVPAGAVALPSVATVVKAYRAHPGQGVFAFVDGGITWKVYPMHGPRHDPADAFIQTHFVTGLGTEGVMTHKRAMEARYSADGKVCTVRAELPDYGMPASLLEKASGQNSLQGTYWFLAPAFQPEQILIVAEPQDGAKTESKVEHKGESKVEHKGGVR